MTTMIDTADRVRFEINTAIEDRAVDLLVSGASFSDLSIVTENDKIWLFAFGEPDSVFWIDSFGFANEGYTITVRGESAAKHKDRAV